MSASRATRVSAGVCPQGLIGDAWRGAGFVSVPVLSALPVRADATLVRRRRTLPVIALAPERHPSRLLWKTSCALIWAGGLCER